MSVLLEGFTVAVSRSSVEAHFKGGWKAFCRFLANRAACSDGQLVASGFPSSADARAFHQFLLFAGLPRTEVLVWEMGQTTKPAETIQVSSGTVQAAKVPVAVLDGGSEKPVAVPKGWMFQYSLTAGGLIDQYEDGAARLRYLREDEEFGTFYLDQVVGEEVLFSSEVPGGFAVAPETVELRETVQRVLELSDDRMEAKADDVRAKIDLELVEKFLDPLKTTLETEGGDGFAFYVLGLIQRVLERTEASEKNLFTAHDHAPGAQNIIRELVLVLQRGGKEQEALSYALEGVSVLPSLSNSWTNLVSCFLRCGESEGALQALDFAKQLDGTDPTVKMLDAAFDTYFAPPTS